MDAAPSAPSRPEERVSAPEPRIETPRLVMRPWSRDDAPTLAVVLDGSRQALDRWTPWVLAETESVARLRRRLERFAQHFASAVEWRYALFHRDDPARPLGECGLFPRVGAGALELGYWLATPATGQGFATEAAGALGDAAFRLDGIDRVEIRCDPDNEASMRVPRRLGYRPRPLLVHEEPVNGRAGGHVVVWERLRGDSRA